MRTFRRRLASFALAVTALQIALLFAAPVSACCTSAAAPTAHAQIAADSGDCCPAGSHAPGQCPLHKGQKSTSRQTSGTSRCRMMCDAPHGAGFVVGGVGVLPAPAADSVRLSSTAFHSTDAVVASVSTPFPDSPPPKLL
jgi:hypothetical protein